MGVALKEAGLARDDIYVTSKYSGVGTISEAIEQSLKKVCSSLFSLFVFFHFWTHTEYDHKIGLSYLDLYLIHSPNSIRGSYEATWKEFEKIKDTGLAKYELNFTTPSVKVNWNNWYIIIHSQKEYRS